MLRNGLEPWHLLVVLAVVVLLFGSKKLPDMARGLGKSMRILKAETAAMREDDPPAGASPSAAASPSPGATPSVGAVPPADPTPTPTPTPAARPTAEPDRRSSRP
ncbi:Sec-independent protein translocase subunit TatA [Kitasatospora sp. NPDC097643]|uniref:Sec-independent protein translocase subunit TatA n=1 Tax=Kitasatospora sp. NPDC097643 TaxID=3157230 RepID=UPI0033295D17